MFDSIIRKAKKCYQRIFWTLEKRARCAGVTMGTGNLIASEFWSSEPYLITIGSNSQITNGVKIHTHGGGNVLRFKYPKFDSFGKVTIGDYVYIGNNSMIMPGVTVGDHVLIAAGSIVTKSIPSGVVVGGNPASYICTVEEYEQRNMQYNIDTKGLSSAAKKEIIQKLPQEKCIVKKNIEIP